MTGRQGIEWLGWTVAAGLGLWASYGAFGPTADGVVTDALCLLLLTVSVLDVKTGHVPEPPILAIGGLGLLRIALTWEETGHAAVVGACIAAALMSVPLWAFAGTMRRRGFALPVTGETAGLFAACGLWLRPTDVPSFLTFALTASLCLHLAYGPGAVRVPPAPALALALFLQVLGLPPALPAFLALG
jgi:hypothetical protein